MLREGLALLCYANLHHAHRPGTGSQPLAIDPRGVQIRQQSLGRNDSNMQRHLFSLMQIWDPSNTERVSEQLSEAVSDNEIVPAKANLHNGIVSSGNIHSSCQEIECDSLADWDAGTMNLVKAQQDCEASQKCIKKAAVELRDDPRKIEQNTWKYEFHTSLDETPLRFKECHDAWREGVVALKNMTAEDIERKFGSLEAMEPYQFVANRLSIEACEEEENFRSVLGELVEGKDEATPLNPDTCYIIRAMAPQRFWQKGPGNKGVLDFGESHSVIAYTLAAMRHRETAVLVEVGLRIKKDMEDVFRKTNPEDISALDGQFCDGDWKTATQACKEEAKTAIESDPLDASQRLFPSAFDEIPTEENLGQLLQHALLKSLLNDPEVHAVYVTALDKQAKRQLRIWKPEVTDFLSSHEDLGPIEPGKQVSASEEESFKKAGLANKLVELTEEDLGKWNLHIETMMASLMKKKSFTMTVPEPLSKVTLEQLEELTSKSHYTRDQVEDYRFVVHCWGEAQQWLWHDAVMLNYKTLFRYLPDEKARNDPNSIAAALREEGKLLSVDPTVSVTSFLVALLANPQVWHNNDLIKLLTSNVAHTLLQQAEIRKTLYGMMGITVRVYARAQFPEVVKAAKAGTEIPGDCQHSIRELLEHTRDSPHDSPVKQEEYPPNGYLCEALSPLTLCLKKNKHYKIAFDCLEGKLIVKSFTDQPRTPDEAGPTEFEAELDETLTLISKSEQFRVELDPPEDLTAEYTLHGILEDGDLKGNEIQLHARPSRNPKLRPDGVNFEYGATCQE